MESPKKKGGEIYTDPENMYDLDGAHSVKTLSERPGSGYGGSPGAPTFKVGTGQKPARVKEGGKVTLDGKDDGSMSDLSTLSKDQLIALLRKKATLGDNHKGSAPKERDAEGFHSDSSDKESGSSGSDGSSSASSSGVEEVGGENGTNGG